MSTERPSARLYPLLARVAQALASPERLRLINLLFQEEKTVDQLAGELGRSAAVTSAHLKALREAHLVETRKEGRHVRCRIAGDDVARLFVALRAVGEQRIPEVREILRALDAEGPGAVALDGPALLARARRGEVVVLDVRAAGEYASGHLPGARSIPFAELECRLDELPADLPIVAYCRGPYCAMAREATALLAARGRRAERLAAGMGEWRAAGLPVESGPPTIH